MIKTHRVSIITIGDELLIGQVTDSNSARMGQLLSEIGIEVSRKWCVGDEKGEILYAMQEAQVHSDLVLVTGGLGPTKDDITKTVMAEFFGVELQFSELAFQHLKSLLDKYKVEIREMHKHQCNLPSNVEILENKLGTAPGMWAEHQGVNWAFMPGVPYEMEYILQHEVIPKLISLAYQSKYRQTTIQTAGIGESEIAHRIEPLLIQMPEYIKLAYLPGTAIVRLRLSGIHDEPAILEQEINWYTEIIIHELDTLVLGTGNDNLPKFLGRMLKENGFYIGTAESCTGGLMAHMITSNAGSSEYFKGSVVAYTKEIKQDKLGVNPTIIEQYGVVSEQTVTQMVKGLCQKLGVDLAIASSGIAGPDGGTEAVPVGTIWLAAGNRESVISQKLQLSKDRARNIERASVMGLLLARRWLLENVDRTVK